MVHTCTHELQVYALDGNAYYARPGPRLLQGCGIIARVLHGDVAGDAIGEDIAPRDSWTIITEPPPPSRPVPETPAPPTPAAAATEDQGGKQECLLEPAPGAAGAAGATIAGAAAAFSAAPATSV